MKNKNVLIRLDALSIVLSVSLLVISIIALAISKSEKFYSMFLGITMIGFILLFTSIINIINGEK